ncbi:IS5 family transposase [Candidatus Bandiella euplotis]|nr:IS5 family transposase [Candidatus Bandiella woodruffii]
MDLGLHRHDITDNMWDLIKDHLPGREGTWGGLAHNNRRFINAVFWILRTGSPWRDLPSEYGGWKNTHKRFCRWRDKRIWEALLEIFVKEPDMEWLMIDASHSKVHPHASGAKGGNQDMSRTKGGFNTKIHLALDSHGMPLKVIITKGSEADCKQAVNLIEEMKAEYLLADRGYDVNYIIDHAQELGMRVVIPPKKNRITQRKYNKDLYKIRHIVENTFLHLKRWRGIATRYAKNSASFLAAIQIRCLSLWLKIS